MLTLWLALLVGFWLYAQAQNQSLAAIFQNWLGQLSESVWGPALLLGLFLLRPLLLLPITLLNVFAGYLFGPVLGLAYGALATLLSSSLAYLLGRFLGAGSSLPAAWVERLRERSFETVLIGRLVFLPGDLINYASGLLRISFVAFLLATLLGGLPGLTISVFAGASVEGQFRFEGVRVNGWFLLASGLLLVFSLSLSYLLRKRRSIPKGSPRPPV